MTRLSKVLRLTGAGVLAVTALLPLASAHADAASYTVYPVLDANGKAVTGGEPSIGYDIKNNVAIFGAGLNIEKLTWDDKADPPAYASTSVAVKPPTDVTTLDAITTVDPSTGRLFNSQLAGACSLMSYSDDDGATWTPSQGCGENTLLDHQSVGAGPLHTPLDADPLAPNKRAVYYCAQNGFNGACAVSLDGGQTFGPGRYAYNTPANAVDDPSRTIVAEGGACSALHGHLKVGPDGTAYLPVKGCGGSASVENGTNTEWVGGRPAMSVSPDNGLTWNVKVVPGANVPVDPSNPDSATNPISNPDESDSTLYVSRATTAYPSGLLYTAWENGTNPSDIVNTDRRQAMVNTYDPATGKWGTTVDLSSLVVDPHTGKHLKNVMFPEVVVGDPDRAVVAFLGTSQLGDTQTNAYTKATTPNDVWDMYVASTFDGGRTWTTVDATPNDPVQRGCIDMQGTAIPPSSRADVCSLRNLLDFNDITVDKQGRPIVGYADGCEDTCPAARTSKSTEHVDKVVRLTSGPGLYAAYDGVLRGSGPGATLPETPMAVLLPLAAAGCLGVGFALRRRRTSAA